MGRIQRYSKRFFYRNHRFFPVVQLKTDISYLSADVYLLFWSVIQELELEKAKSS